MENLPAATAEPIGAIVNRRLIQFDPVTGIPGAVVVPTIAKTHVADIAIAALSQPYPDPLGLEPEYAGRPIIEVIYVKAANRAAVLGDLNTLEIMLDRGIGKPKQTSESLVVKASYEDWLKGVANKLQSQPPPIEAEILPPLQETGLDSIFGDLS